MKLLPHKYDVRPPSGPYYDNPERDCNRRWRVCMKCGHWGWYHSSVEPPDSLRSGVNFDRVPTLHHRDCGNLVFTDIPGQAALSTAYMLGGKDALLSLAESVEEFL